MIPEAEKALPQPALVLVSYGSRGIAQAQDGERVDCQYRRSVGRPLCGDEVLIERQPGGDAVVCEILPRQNLFARADRRHQKQAVAANLDQVAIVLAASPAPSRDLVERYLVAAHSLEIKPLLVLNKVDLLASSDLPSDNPLHRLDEYVELGYRVIRTSCKGDPGTDELAEALQNHTSILVGQSGVGKSSLANDLLPDLGLQTGELSRTTGKGTHTTTTTIMYALPCGGWLVDSPGVWEYGLWEMEPTDLIRGFPDLAEHAPGCRFNNCRHAGEPGCAVQSAVQEGVIRDWRHQSWLRLLQQGMNF